MMQFDVENEIDILESALDHLTDAMQECLESPYHKYLAQSIEADIDEIKSRLDELYEVQNNYWAAELKQQNIEFERSIM